jgi:hypothetical protein
MSALFFRRKIIRIAIMTFMVFSISNPLISQKLTDKQKAGEDIFIARIKQFNEFVERFNFKSDFNGNPVDSAFMVKMPRQKMISLLFDLKDPRNDPKNKEYSNVFIKTREGFISDVVQKNLLLNTYSSNIIAEARTKVIYNGESHVIRIFLNQEIVGNDMVKWILVSVKGDIFNFFKPDTSLIRFIPPASNETDFMNLKRALEDTDHLQYYASHDFEPDILSIFFYCIKSGVIKYEYVEDIVYHIIAIPGWYIKVKEFNRNELNSGWLITDVMINNLDLDDFLKKL